MEARGTRRNKVIFATLLIIIINRMQYSGTIKITATYKKMV